jgi:endothelin-converting enzyme/putative endopeptidase
MTDLTRRLFVSSSLVAAVAACSRAPGASAHSGIDLAAMDRSVRPGADFWAYANGTWLRNTEIPADRSSVGAGYEAFLETERNMQELIDTILRGRPQANSDEARIANFYNAFNNSAAIDAAGMAPVQGDLARFAAIQSRADLSRVLGEQTRADVDPLNNTNFQTENLFGIFVTQGLATPGEVLPYILQGGLGLPEREYYLSSEADMATIRGQYRAYVQRLLTLANYADAQAAAQRIFDLETRIARAHNTREQSDDWAHDAGVWTRAELERNAPGIDWTAFLNAARLGSQQRFAVYHAEAMPKLAALVASQPLQAWKDWLAFHQINSHANVLPSAIDNASFGFYGTTLSGTPQQRPRAKRAISAVSAFLGDAVGKAYAHRYFPSSARDKIRVMSDNIKAAFARRLEALEWMAPATRAEALRKVQSIEVGVGYPDSWRDYSTLTVSADNAYANSVAAEKFEYVYQLSKIGRPMDRKEWWMTPQTVNAVNLPVQNALNFPAAELQRPYFDPLADDAFNYGATGATIGHEVSHSFDNNGALFDSTGALRNWWTPSDLAAFQAQGQALARQYDAYEPLPGLHIKGALTLSENIADLAGLRAAYEAYHASLNGRAPPVIDGLTGDQRFFIAYAQSWKLKLREASLRQEIATDGHAPDQYRVLTVRNLDAWYQAFDVQPGDALYLAPEQRVRVW